jgi:anti-sigma regulatory factor (Ser/Thr protein kinase)
MIDRAGGHRQETPVCTIRARVNVRRRCRPRTPHINERHDMVIPLMKQADEQGRDEHVALRFTAVWTERAACAVEARLALHAVLAQASHIGRAPVPAPVALDAALVVSELVTNAIRYGAPPIQLRLIRDQTLICEVSDGSSTSPHLRRAHQDDEGGRGLLLVAQLTQRWGSRQTTRGKTIWCEQSLTPLF